MDRCTFYEFGDNSLPKPKANKLPMIGFIRHVIKSGRGYDCLSVSSTNVAEHTALLKKSRLLLTEGKETASPRRRTINFLTFFTYDKHLQQSEEVYRDWIQAMRDLMWMCEREGKESDRLYEECSEILRIVDGLLLFGVAS